MMRKRKFKLFGEQLYKRHAISILMRAYHSAEPGRFQGKGLQMRWVVLPREEYK